jgi:hypothetical protein
MPEDRKRMVCAHCGNQTILVVRAEYHKKDIDWYSPGPKENHSHWSILECESCYGISVQEMSYSTIAGVQHSNYKRKVLYPMSRPELPNLPVKVEKAYRDALKVEKVDPNACAVLVGRTLEAACNHEQAPGRVLADKLTYLANAGRIPETLAEMAQQLRQLRNFGAHDAEDTVTEEDIPTILYFLEAILEYLYVAPAKVAAVQARLKKTPKAAPQAP